MTTYSIGEFTARVDEVIRDLDDGEEVIITRHGTPFGRLSSIVPPPGESLRSVAEGLLGMPT